MDRRIILWLLSPLIPLVSDLIVEYDDNLFSFFPPELVLTYIAEPTVESNQTTWVAISNTGSQAKNVEVALHTNDSRGMFTHYICSEGDRKMSSSNNTDIIELDRLSNNVHCIFTYTTAENSPLIQIDVTADDVQGIQESITKRDGVEKSEPPFHYETKRIIALFFSILTGVWLFVIVFWILDKIKKSKSTNDTATGVGPMIRTVR